MNQISMQQWHDLGRESFETRLVGVIRRHHPRQSAGVGEPRLRALIAEQLPRARAYGLVDECSAATFVCAAWMLGRGFDERVPFLAQTLRSQALTARTKATMLTDFLLATFRALDASAERAQGAA